MSSLSLSSSSLSSPESSAASVGFIDMSDLLLPASALESELFGVPRDSNATVVSAASCDEIPSAVITTTFPAHATTTAGASHVKRRKSRTLDELSRGEDATPPAPDFLCHLLSMLREPSHAALLSFTVPTQDEPDRRGGGLKGRGKIVVHQPEALQEFVLGKYYRHSKYASFQRQLNYFGFKKRLHDGKKGKLSPCSYIHERLTDEPGSLLRLKRRPPCRKRAGGTSSLDEARPSSTKPQKKPRVTDENKMKQSKKNRSKSENIMQCGDEPQAVVSVPREAQAEEPDAAPVSSVSPTAIITSQAKAVSPTSKPTLLDLLSTFLPPSEVLFNDAANVHSVDADGIPAWVTDDGAYHYHNVDSSLIDLAMLY